MTAVELAVVAVGLAAPLVAVLPRIPDRVRLALVALCGAALVAAATVDSRWQLAPIVIGAVGAFAVWTLQKRNRNVAARLVAGLCVLSVCAGAVAMWAFPRLALPAPTGPIAVGTTVVEWTDTSRAESATPDPADRRTVVVQFWYPAEAGTGADFAPYLGRNRHESDVVAAAIADGLGIPAFLLNDAAAGRTDSLVDAAPATDTPRFPVVVFSPGLGGVRTQNTALAQELASHGYLVAAIDHPYDSAAVVLSSGTVLSAIVTTGDHEADERASDAWAAVRAADVSFVLGRILSGPLPVGLDDRVDADRVAAVGHSVGGAVALAAGSDPRFDALVSIDGYPLREPDATFPQPALALVAGVSDATPDERGRLDATLISSASTSYRLVVDDVAHLGFTDSSVFLPPVPSVFGTRGRGAGSSAAAAAILLFLDATLRDGPDPRPYLEDVGAVEVYGHE